MQEPIHIPRRRSLSRLQPHSKILFSAIIALIWSVTTDTHPPNRQLLKDISHIGTTYEDIFETTIAIQKKRFTKRIIEESEGYWSYIPYAKQSKWIDLEILLTTRIGFDIRNGFASIEESGKINVNVFEPTILSKTWSTQIIDKSDTMFNKWDIRDYKARENQVLQVIAMAQSQNLLEVFRSDPAKMGELAERLDQKLEMKSSIFHKPMEMIDSLNRVVNQKVKNIGNMLRGREIPEVFNQKDYRTSQSKGVKDNKSQVQVSRGPDRKNAPKQMKKIAMTESEMKMRNEMKNKLNL